MGARDQVAGDHQDVEVRTIAAGGQVPAAGQLEVQVAEDPEPHRLLRERGVIPGKCTRAYVGNAGRELQQLTPFRKLMKALDRRDGKNSVLPFDDESNLSAPDMALRKEFVGVAIDPEVGGPQRAAPVVAAGDHEMRQVAAVGRVQDVRRERRIPLGPVWRVVGDDHQVPGPRLAELGLQESTRFQMAREAPIAAPRL
jgi:hypothetical protein